MSLVGSLEDLGLGEILQIVSLSRKTGVLSLHSRGRDGSIIFRQGQVVRAISSTFQQSLGEVLIQRGCIDSSILRKSLALQQEEGFSERLGVILIKHFGVSQDVVETVVREQIENVVFSLFTWVDGSFEFIVQEHIETVDGTRLDPLQFMLDQGLNPQFLAMEGTRILDENRHAESGILPQEDYASQDDDLEFDLVDTPAGNTRTGSAGIKAHPRLPLVVVDDDTATLQAIADGMQGLGYDVHALSHSEDTLIKVDSLCRGGEHPAVLIDLIMPKMDGSGVLGGLELLELLHNNFKDIHIIVMTDYLHDDAQKKVLSMKYPFITKPRRSEIGNAACVKDFIGVLNKEVCRANDSAEESDVSSSNPFNLGDELREELGDDTDVPELSEHEGGGGFSLLRGMLEELNNPDMQGDILLLVLRFASEFFNRAIVFTVSDKVVSGAGQFGVSSGALSGDEKVRNIHFSLGAISMFAEPAKNGKPITFIPHPSPLDAHIFDQLGGVPGEAFIGPLISQSHIVGFLYGDNHPDKKPVGDVESLAIFLSQAGVAMEKSMLERQLQERAVQ